MRVLISVATGALEKAIGVQTVRVLVSVATGALEESVGVQTVRVLVSVATGTLEESIGVKRMCVLVTVATGTLVEEPVKVHFVRVSVTVAMGADGSLGVSGMTEDEELGGGATTETLVETTTEVDETTEVDSTIFLKAKSTSGLSSWVVIYPLR